MNSDLLKELDFTEFLHMIIFDDIGFDGAVIGTLTMQHKMPE
jgi:hypothetical protein